MIQRNFTTKIETKQIRKKRGKSGKVTTKFSNNGVYGNARNGKARNGKQ